jgi:excisionase family DNA binding protein
MEKYLTVSQVSQALQIHWQTTLSYIKLGKLKAIRVGRGYRIGESDLKEFIETIRVKKEKK